ncbi:MAG TPA: hypothetical protein VMY06_14680 [Sedimentisphaerales bacterium]|nr:hypothetical protein [Sedimentisphaerales bacterium]HUU15613.1 hypothetical protein [Sedimentisphaerales bacterium]
MESPIEEAMKQLRKAVLIETSDLSKRFRENIVKCENYKKDIRIIIDIIHNIPDSKNKEIKREICKVWKVLQKYYQEST